MTIVLKIGLFLLVASIYTFVKVDVKFGPILIIPFSIGLVMTILEGFRMIAISLGWV